MKTVIRASMLLAAATLAGCAAWTTEPPERPMASAPVPPPDAGRAPAALPANALAVVESVQSPVWVKRAGRKQALRAGEAVQRGDTFSTGSGARLQLRLADASTVKLGEDAEMAVPILKETGDGTLKGALSVIRGAFRFTTSALGKDRRRDFAVSIGGAITAGVRGTDLWGKSGDGQNLVCLIEGTIDVQASGAEAQQLTQSRAAVRVTEGQPAESERISESQLAVFAAQTEPAPGVPQQLASGEWGLALAAERNAEEAARTVARLGRRGYAVTVSEVDVGGTRWHRLVLPGFASASEARERAAALEEELGLSGPWVPPPR